MSQHLKCAAASDAAGVFINKARRLRPGPGWYSVSDTTRAVFQTGSRWPTGLVLNPS